MGKVLLPVRRAVHGVGVPLESQSSSFQFSDASSQQLRAEFAKLKEQNTRLRRVARTARDAIDDMDREAVTRRSAKITAADATFAPGGATGPEYLRMAQEKHDRLEAEARAKRAKDVEKGTKEREKKDLCKEAYDALVGDHEDDPEWVESGDFVLYRTIVVLKLILDTRGRRWTRPGRSPKA